MSRWSKTLGFRGIFYSRQDLIWRIVHWGEASRVNIWSGKKGQKILTCKEGWFNKFVNEEWDDWEEVGIGSVDVNVFSEVAIKSKVIEEFLLVKTMTFLVKLREPAASLLNSSNPF